MIFDEKSYNEVGIETKEVMTSCQFVDNNEKN